MMNVAKTVSLVKNPQLEGNGLKVGDFVFVRVLKQLENKKALVSIAGQNTEVTIEDKNQIISKNPKGLINGGFRAKILQRGDLIVLQLQDSLETPENQNILLEKNPIKNFINQSDIKNYLQNLGLVPDAISFKIVQFIQQMGYYVNHKKIDEIRKIVLQFHGNEKKASEIAMYLEEKGLPVTKESIEDFMNKILGLKDFDNNFLAKSNSSKTLEKYWICLPFQYDFGFENTYGTIFLLKNKNTSKVELINLRLKSKENTFLFRIYLKNQYNQAKMNVIKILFYIEPLEQEKISSLCSLIKNLFNDENDAKDKNQFQLQVIFSDEIKESLFFSDDTGLISVDTNA